MNKKHYVVYWQENLLQFVTTTPRDWARQFAQNHGITENARTQRIEDVLKAKFHFVEFTFDDSVVLCNLNTITPMF